MVPSGLKHPLHARQVASLVSPWDQRFTRPGSRIKAATGDTPLTYQQRVRVEKAKRMLEDGQRSFEEITYQVGYEDSGSFRKVFIRKAGLRPTEYRDKFQRI